MYFLRNTSPRRHQILHLVRKTDGNNGESPCPACTARAAGAAPSSVATAPTAAGSLCLCAQTAPPPQQAYTVPPAQPYAAQPYAAQPYAPAPDPNALPPGSKYEPITTGGFIGIMLLMMLPIVNLILLLVWACGGCRKVNKTNFARAMLIIMLISAVLSGIIFLIFGSMFGSGLSDITDTLKSLE